MGWPDSRTEPQSEPDDKEISMPNLRTIAPTAAIAAAALLALIGPRNGRAEEVKYYFKISNVQAQESRIVPMARDLLEREVQSRPELTTEAGEGAEEAARLAALKQRGTQACLVSMRIMRLNKEIKPPAPGRRDPQMAIEVKLSIFGHTLPGNKALFTGDGESALVGDFSERLKDKEEENFTKTALAAAIKQAVTTGVEKLTHSTLEEKKPAKAKKARGKR